MAVSVDTVYKTVLLILNKEQRGYITPAEFNKIGEQVQLEIFENYFEDLNQQLRVPENNSEYANRVKNLYEKIDINNMLLHLIKDYDVIFYVSPEGVKMEDNGVRETNLEYRDAINKEILKTIRINKDKIQNLTYLKGSTQERINKIRETILLL